MEELEFIMHILAAVVAIGVTIFLVPVVWKNFKLKSGFVYELSWFLFLPAIFIAVFSSIYALKEGISGSGEIWEVLEIVAEVFVILASASILVLGLKIRAYMKKIGD